jgi:hypothetical protein
MVGCQTVSCADPDDPDDKQAPLNPSHVRSVPDKDLLTKTGWRLVLYLTYIYPTRDLIVYHIHHLTDFLVILIIQKII